jgi:hypothetical protein
MIQLENHWASMDEIGMDIVPLMATSNSVRFTLPQ